MAASHPALPKEQGPMLDGPWYDPFCWFVSCLKEDEDEMPEIVEPGEVDIKRGTSISLIEFHAGTAGMGTGLLLLLIAAAIGAVALNKWRRRRRQRRREKVEEKRRRRREDRIERESGRAERATAPEGDWREWDRERQAQWPRRPLPLGPAPPPNFTAPAQRLSSSRTWYTTAEVDQGESEAAEVLRLLLDRLREPPRRGRRIQDARRYHAEEPEETVEVVGREGEA